jgi:hypothetical protein
MFGKQEAVGGAMSKQTKDSTDTPIAGASGAIGFQPGGYIAKLLSESGSSTATKNGDLAGNQK